MEGKRRIDTVTTDQKDHFEDAEERGFHFPASEGRKVVKKLPS